MSWRANHRKPFLVCVILVIASLVVQVLTIKIALSQLSESNALLQESSELLTSQNSKASGSRSVVYHARSCFVVVGRHDRRKTSTFRRPLNVLYTQLLGATRAALRQAFSLILIDHRLLAGFCLPLPELGRSLPMLC